MTKTEIVAEVETETLTMTKIETEAEIVDSKQREEQGVSERQ